MKKFTLLLSCLALLTMARAEGGPAADGLPLPTGGQALSLLAPSPQAQPPHIELKYYGFYAVVDYAFMLNLNKQHDEYVDDFMLHGITAVAGWQWRKESAVGLGFSYLYDPNGSFTQIPVFLEFRSHYLRSRLTPFTAVQLGLTVPFGSVNDDPDYTKIVDGGLAMGLEVGGRYAITPRAGLNFYVGYQMLQNRNVERGDANTPATRLPELYHLLKAGVGLNF